MENRQNIINISDINNAAEEIVNSILPNDLNKELSSADELMEKFRSFLEMKGKAGKLVLQESVDNVFFLSKNDIKFILENPCDGNDFNLENYNEKGTFYLIPEFKNQYWVLNIIRDGKLITTFDCTNDSEQDAALSSEYYIMLNLAKLIEYGNLLSELLSIKTIDDITVELVENELPDDTLIGDLSEKMPLKSEKLMNALKCFLEKMQQEGVIELGEDNAFHQKGVKFILANPCIESDLSMKDYNEKGVFYLVPKLEDQHWVLNIIKDGEFNFKFDSIGDLRQINDYLSGYCLILDFVNLVKSNFYSYINECKNEYERKNDLLTKNKEQIVDDKFLFIYKKDNSQDLNSVFDGLLDDLSIMCDFADYFLNNYTMQARGYKQEPRKKEGNFIAQYIPQNSQIVEYQKDLEAAKMPREEIAKLLELVKEMKMLHMRSNNQQDSKQEPKVLAHIYDRSAIDGFKLCSDQISNFDSLKCMPSVSTIKQRFIDTIIYNGFDDHRKAETFLKEYKLDNLLSKLNSKLPLTVDDISEIIASKTKNNIIKEDNIEFHICKARSSAEGAAELLSDFKDDNVFYIIPLLCSEENCWKLAAYKGKEFLADLARYISLDREDYLSGYFFIAIVAEMIKGGLYQSTESYRALLYEGHKDIKKKIAEDKVGLIFISEIISRFKNVVNMSDVLELLRITRGSHNFIEILTDICTSIDNSLDKQIENINRFLNQYEVQKYDDALCEPHDIPNVQSLEQTQNQKLKNTTFFEIADDKYGFTKSKGQVRGELEKIGITAESPIRKAFEDERWLGDEELMGTMKNLLEVTKQESKIDSFEDDQVNNQFVFQQGGLKFILLYPRAYENIVLDNYDESGVFYIVPTLINNNHWTLRIFKEKEEFFVFDSIKDLSQVDLYSCGYRVLLNFAKILNDGFFNHINNCLAKYEEMCKALHVNKYKIVIDEDYLFQFLLNFLHYQSEHFNNEEDEKDRQVLLMIIGHFNKVLNGQVGAASDILKFICGDPFVYRTTVEKFKEINNKVILCAAIIETMFKSLNFLYRHPLCKQAEIKKEWDNADGLESMRASFKRNNVVSDSVRVADKWITQSFASPEDISELRRRLEEHNLGYLIEPMTNGVRLGESKMFEAIGTVLNLQANDFKYFIQTESGVNFVITYPQKEQESDKVAKQMFEEIKSPNTFFIIPMLDATQGYWGLGIYRDGEFLTTIETYGDSNKGNKLIEYFFLLNILDSVREGFYERANKFKKIYQEILQDVTIRLIKKDFDVEFLNNTIMKLKKYFDMDVAINSINGYLKSGDKCKDCLRVIYQTEKKALEKGIERIDTFLSIYRSLAANATRIAGNHIDECFECCEYKQEWSQQQNRLAMLSWINKAIEHANSEEFGIKKTNIALGRIKELRLYYEYLLKVAGSSKEEAINRIKQFIHIYAGSIEKAEMKDHIEECEECKNTYEYVMESQKDARGKVNEDEVIEWMKVNTKIPGCINDTRWRKAGAHINECSECSSVKDRDSRLARAYEHAMNFEFLDEQKEKHLEDCEPCRNAAQERNEEVAKLMEREGKLTFDKYKQHLQNPVIDIILQHKDELRNLANKHLKGCEKCGKLVEELKNRKIEDAVVNMEEKRKLMKRVCEHAIEVAKKRGEQQSDGRGM